MLAPCLAYYSRKKKVRISALKKLRYACSSGQECTQVVKSVTHSVLFSVSSGNYWMPLVKPKNAESRVGTKDLRVMV
jgi:hypothetical protein